MAAQAAQKFQGLALFTWRARFSRRTATIAVGAPGVLAPPLVFARSMSDAGPSAQPARPMHEDGRGAMREMTIQHLVIVITTAALALFTCAACSTQMLPAARISASEATIRSARDIGTEQVPEAAAHLELAQQ